MLCDLCARFCECVGVFALFPFVNLCSCGGVPLGSNIHGLRLGSRVPPRCKMVYAGRPQEHREMYRPDTLDDSVSVLLCVCVHDCVVVPALVSMWVCRGGYRE